MQAKVWEDPRVVAGMDIQLRKRQAAMADGRVHRGWKLGLGAPALREKLDIAAPLLGFLLTDGVLASGSKIDLAGWTKPMLEAEIAVHMGSDLAAGAADDTARAAIAGIGAAIELADVDAPLDDAKAALGANIFQRHFVLGPVVSQWDAETLRGWETEISVNREVVQTMPDPMRLTGGLIENVRHVADYLAAFGLTLKRDDVIITGSITPPIFVVPGQSVETRTHGLGPSLSLVF